MIPDNVLTPPAQEPHPQYRLATVVAVTANGVSLQFEGEDTATDKEYTVMQQYAPKQGERVVTMYISGTYIALGSVGPPKDVYIPIEAKGAANGVATLDSAGKITPDQMPALDFIPLDQKGAANGVPTLDSNSRIPASQIPSLSYIPSSEKGQANGVATLNSSGRVAQMVETALRATDFSESHTGSRISFFNGSTATKRGTQNLSSGATLEQTVSKVNALLNILRDYGLIGTS